MPLAALESYDIDSRTGFVPPADPLTQLPSYFDAWNELAPLVGSLMRNRRLRERLRTLPLLDTTRLASARERELALTLLCVYANAFVWGGPEPDLRLPAPVAVPLCRLADALGRPPIVHYASMQLHNWRRIEAERAPSADNVAMIVQFLGGVDETWFFVAGLDVELQGAPLVVHAHGAVLAAARADHAALTRHLASIAAGMPAVNAALERQREWVDPHIFFHRVRPYVAGWPAPGVVYEGVSEAPRMAIGGSAGQSALIQSLDAALGIAHPGEQTGSYLKLLRAYMPPGHRRFVEDCERESRVRAEADAAGVAELRDAYNAAIEGIGRFRSLHMALAHDYISKPAGGDPDPKGTGGTSFTGFLRDARRETSASRVG
ncbi:MAG: hypothetical protein JNM79_21290 [Burkholderiales bacterium]|nr:hypothetical protein [Burkholderiales bacterium]